MINALTAVMSVITEAEKLSKSRKGTFTEEVLGQRVGIIPGTSPI